MTGRANILVFGKTGQVGRELALRAPGAIILSRAEADLSRPEAVSAALEAAGAVSAIVNVAAYTAVDKAEAEPDQAQAVNATAVGLMARHAAAREIPFMQVSTDYVFDGSGSAPRAPDAPTGPLGVYGASKLAGEALVREAGGTHAILRTSWVFSAHGTNFLKTMLRLSETRDRLTVVADQVGGPTPAAAIAAACLCLVRDLQEDPGRTGTYHFSGSPDVSWAGFAREIFAAAGRQVEVVDIPSSDYPTPAVRPLNSRLDCSSLREAFGIERPDWRAAIRQIVRELA